ncbi:MAG: AEC family transporter [Eubacteriaceae bacterium]|jgi:predicted permease|nr:AEC family transporter [Eubacteriaceae bacterium]
MYGQFFVMFAMILTGYILRKIGLIKESMNEGLNNFILFFSFPCLVIENVGTLELNSRIIEMFIVMALLSFVITFGGTLLCRGFCALRKYPKRVRTITELSMNAPNSGFLGFPIVLALYGQHGLLLFIASSFAFNIYMYGYAVASYHRFDENRKKEKGAAVKIAAKTMINPNIIALFIGFAISLLHLTIPAPAESFLNYMGGVATPMAMVYIGSSLTGTKFTEMFKNHIIWESALMKLFVVPAAALAVVYFLPIDVLVKACLVLMVAFPTAALVPMLADMEGKENDIGVQSLFFSTVLSMGTLLFWIFAISRLLH